MPSSLVVKGQAPTGQRAPSFYSVAEAASLFGMSEMTLYRAIHAGQFPAVRIRGRLIIPAKAIEAMIEAAVRDGRLVDAADWVPNGLKQCASCSQPAWTMVESAAP